MAFSLAKVSKSREEIIEMETAVWAPSETLDDKQLDAYINEAINKYSYTKEQALVLLYWNKHDIQKSLSDMNKYVPKPNDWTSEEKILFEQAYWMYGKNFNKIRQVVFTLEKNIHIYFFRKELNQLFLNLKKLPDKTQGSLVTFYYAWKKSRLQTSAMDSANAKNSLNFDYTKNESNGNGLLSGNGDFDMLNLNSDDSDSVEQTFDVKKTKLFFLHYRISF